MGWGLLLSAQGCGRAPKKAHHCHSSLSGEAAVQQCLLGNKVDISTSQKFHFWENTLRELCTDPQEGGMPLFVVGQSWMQPECP